MTLARIAWLGVLSTTPGWIVAALAYWRGGHRPLALMALFYALSNVAMMFEGQK